MSVGDILSVGDIVAGQTGEFRLTEEDYRSANLLHLSSHRWLYFIVVAVAVLVGARSLSHTAGAWNSPPVVGTVLGIGVAIAMLLAVLAAARRFGVRWHTRRYFAQHKAMQRPRRVSWDGDYLATEGADFKSRTPWTDVRQWRQNKQVIALYETDRMVHILPKRVLDAQQLVDLLRTIKEKIAPRPGMKRRAA